MNRAKWIERERRRAERARLLAQGQRARASWLLQRAGHVEITIRTCRAVIGQPFEHARLAEALVAFRGERPVYVRADRLEAVLSRVHTLRMDTPALWKALQAEGRAWKHERKPVKHPKRGRP